MERVTNTLLPARMLVACSGFCYENGVHCTSFDEISRRAEKEVIAKEKINAYFFSELLYAELKALWNGILTK